MAKSNLDFSLFLTLYCRMTLEWFCGLLLLYIKTLLKNGKKLVGSGLICEIYIPVRYTIYLKKILNSEVLKDFNLEQNVP